MSSDLWLAGQPNGGLKQPCTLWYENNPKGSLFDVPCLLSTRKMHCLCQFIHSPILRLRGLCQGSKIDTHFTLKSLNGTVVFMGLTGTMIRFLPKTNKWRLDVSIENIIGWTSAEETSFILGRHDWSIDGDLAKCSKDQPSQLKMSSCDTDGEFTCDDGQCVTMTQMCDQIPNCKDKSDEENCQLLVKGK